MTKTILYFNSDDEAMNLRATVSWRDKQNVNIPELSIRGLGKWRHFPANIIACSERAIDVLKLESKAQRLSQVGINYVGISAKTDIMLSKNLRSGKNGTKKVMEFLRKFFVKGLNASSVSFEVLEVQSQN